MDEKEIFLLFSSFTENSDQKTESVREVFSALIKSTLRYRDHILRSRGIVITVEDVRTALDWLIPTLQTGRLPNTSDKIKLDMLKLWLDELRCLNIKDRL